MANRDHRFREEGYNRKGNWEVRFKVSIDGVELEEIVEIDCFDLSNAQLVMKVEDEALARLGSKIKQEENRQTEAALGFGYVGG